MNLQQVARSLKVTKGICAVKVGSAATQCYKGVMGIRLLLGQPYHIQRRAQSLAACLEGFSPGKRLEEGGFCPRGGFVIAFLQGMVAGQAVDFRQPEILFAVVGKLLGGLKQQAGLGAVALLGQKALEVT